MLVQLPRLSSSLRDPVDVDQAYLQRKIILQNNNSKPRRSGNPLDESELARKIVDGCEQDISMLKLGEHMLTFGASCTLVAKFFLLILFFQGSQLYDPEAGGWRDLGMLDVMQMFGRAGRPQFDKSGGGIIISSHDKLAYYLRLLTSELPIESRLLAYA
ncbi:hypothetical protein SLEP1_g41686 [Rubroshorea leprosula]|uniref:Uncharacterized protein n=1 Tax=Rubroshorea leprosula TaxID=152421 RepID=A0AAV5L8N5_9ROSI|nr:hypothetical protein SLEP1_g41686 [Rubroshorea leprosula]